MTMVKYEDKPERVVRLTRRERLEIERIQEERLQQQKMSEIVLILGNLFAREEATVKLVLSSLYDVGAANLINKKVGFRPLNKLAKAIATMSKPAFLIVGFRWFKSNCPQLIVDWLESKVTF